MSTQVLAHDDALAQARTEDAIAMMRNTMPERLVRFADRYLVDLDARAAAESVGAPTQAQALMRDPRTLAYISAVCGALRRVHADLRAQMVGLLTQMALYDPKGAIGPTGWLPLDQWPDNLRACVEGLTFYESGQIKSVKWVRRLDVVDRLLALTGGVDRRIERHHASVVFEVERE